jgi:hypothetical protein
MASTVYQSGLGKVIDRTIDYIADTIKCYLVAATYTADPDHDFVSDVTEIGNVTGYTGGFGGAGRQTLGSKTITIDDTNNRIRLTAADASFGALGTGVTIRGYAFTKETTNDAASRVLSFRQLASDTPTNGSSVTAEIATNDVLRINC